MLKNIFGNKTFDTIVAPLTKVQRDLEALAASNDAEVERNMNNIAELENRNFDLMAENTKVTAVASKIKAFFE